MSKENQNKNKDKNSLWIVLACIFWLIVVSLFSCVLPVYFLILRGLVINKTLQILIFTGGLLLISIFAFLQIYFRLAPNNIFWTFVQEGTSKIVLKGEQVVKILTQWKGYKNDKDGNIVEGKSSWRLFGGLRFIGIWPIYTIYRYKFRWTSVQENGQTVSHEDQLDSVLLKEKIYSIKMKTVEDKNNMPLNIDILVTLKIINPYKALFIAEDYLELVLNRIRPLFREYVGGVPFSELKDKKQRAGGEIWQKLQEEELIQEFEKDWGVKIKDGGIEMTDVNPINEQYRKATTQKYLADREAERVAGETIGSVINMMAVSYGLSFEEMQNKINKSTQLQKEFRDFCKETLHKKMAMDSGSYVKIDVNGGGDTEKTFMNLAAAWLRMPQGEKKAEEKKEKTKKKDKELEYLEKLEKGDDDEEEES